MLAVVFDTNVYRGISDTTLDEIIESEAALGVQPLLNYLVATEALIHLASPDNADYASSMATIRRLVRHCAVPRGGDARVKFLPTADQQVIAIAFNVRDSKAEGLDHELYRRLLAGIVNEPRDHWEADHRLLIATIAGRVD